MAHQQRAATCAQCRIKLDQRLANELDPSICLVVQSIEISRSKTKAQKTRRPRRRASHNAA